MSEHDDDVHVRLGRIRDRRVGKPKPFVHQVLRAAKKAGSGEVGGRRLAGGSRSGFGRGRTAFSRSRLFNPQRRVIVKARIVRGGSRGARSAPLTAHVSYLKRDGVTRDGARGRMFDATADDADGKAFAERCGDDRHHFRLIVSPEDAGEMSDLRAFTRDLTTRMETDLGTQLDWIAIDHWNTDNPHVHLLVRGVADDGRDLVIARDYIGRGLRSRAKDIVSLELGPKPEQEIRSALERDVQAERWTKLDTAIRFEANETGIIDVTPADAGAGDPQIRRLMIGRLQRLERMGLASPAGPSQWTLSPDAEPVLRDLAVRGDIIKTIHDALAGRGLERPPGDYVIEGGAATAPIIGRLLQKGLYDELNGEAYAVIDGVDGRVHHVRFKGLDALEHAAPEGGIVELRRFGAAQDRAPTLLLVSRSDSDLASQVEAPGATWLDHRLVSNDDASFAHGGFGAEARTAVNARIERLIDEGLARRQGQRVIFARNLLDTLRRRELDAVGTRLAAELNRPYRPAESGDQIGGVYQRRLSLSSGRFAMLDDGLGFSLVPWSPSLERQPGRHVGGIARSDGGIDWTFGRNRGLGL
jgi:type IV secretory pathway VirD2 relaxase